MSLLFIFLGLPSIIIFLAKSWLSRESTLAKRPHEMVLYDMESSKRVLNLRQFQRTQSNIFLPQVICPSSFLILPKRFSLDFLVLSNAFPKLSLSSLVLPYPFQKRIFHSSSTSFNSRFSISLAISEMGVSSSADFIFSFFHTSVAICIVLGITQY